MQLCKEADMDMNGLLFFDEMPKGLPIYEAFLSEVLSRWPDVDIAVQKTQIRFKNRYGFAWVWLPIHRIKGKPDDFIFVSFGLDHRVESPRIWQAVEPYPNRWTHHVIVSSPEDVDRELMGWVEEAYRFSMTKSRKKKD